MTPQKSFELTARSAVIRGEKANKGVDALPAPNPNQMNRIKGFLDDGTPVMVAQRPGRGGMDFTKLMGGKVFAVAADSISPVFEKGGDGKPTKTQKVEDGLPLYSSSGFYTLSTKEYPALAMFEAYTLLQEKGSILWMLTNAQLAERKVAELSSDLDWDLLALDLEAALGDEHNLVAPHDEAMNKKRMRGVERAKQEAEDNDDTYTGVAFKEVSVSPKDGNPFVYFSWAAADGSVHTGALVRQAEVLDDADRPVTRYMSAAEAMTHFAASKDFKPLADELAAGRDVKFGWVQGHVMRTSVSFRRKAENVFAAEKTPQYGDAVYIQAAHAQWTKGLLSVLHSMHPNFPQADYTAHHYVVSPRQAEVGMNKAGTGWTPPQGVGYDIAQLLRS
jgi:hypothetical protein